MVSNSELIERLREFLQNSDLDTTTTGIVRRKLEEDFGVDLSDKKQFIREQVDLFLQGQHENAEEEAEEGHNKVKEEEELEEEENDEEDEEDEREVESTSNSKGKRRSKKLDHEVKKRGGGGFCKVCSLSPQLQEFVGVPEMARTEVVKRIWAYIKEKDLQDPSNRRNIVCDESLRPLFGVNSINMFQMNKALAKHIWPLDSNDVIPVESTPKEKPERKEKKRKKKRDEEDSDSKEPKQKEKQQKGGAKSGFLAPLQLSDALRKFLGTGESELSRCGVVKRMWDYIKQNNLQDPSDKRMIICDEKLKELFDVDTFTGFTVSKLLASHLTRAK